MLSVNKDSYGMVSSWSVTDSVGKKILYAECSFLSGARPQRFMRYYYDITGRKKKVMEYRGRKLFKVYHFVFNNDEESPLELVFDPNIKILTVGGKLRNETIQL